MKTLFLSVSFLLVFILNSAAQYCGNSGTGICTPSGSLIADGFTPSENIPCLIRGQLIQQAIQFKNPLTLAGGAVTVTSITIDSMRNLPNGLCWATNKTNNSFAGGESGCILITGSTASPPGQYRIRVFVSLVTNAITIQGDLYQLHQQYSIAGNFDIRLRLIDQSFSACPPVDTQQGPYIFFSGLYQGRAEIKGTVFFDLNQNNVQDNGEGPLAGQLVNIVNDYVGVTNQSGTYYAYPLPGVYTVKPRLSQNFSGFTIVPDSLVVHANSAAVSYPGNNFAVIPPPNYCGATLSIVTINPPPRPGFNNQVALLFHNNMSTSAVSQTIRLNYDANQVFSNSNPNPILVDTVNRFIQWDVAGINPGASWSANSVFYTPPSVAINTILHYSSQILNASCAPLDTLTAHHERVVVGSYDPNDKSVSPAGEGNTGRILPTTALLTYTVRFQNTGTYAAQNVKVIDTISQYLDINSLQILSASHNYEVWINGREVNFMFNNINLPDSNSNEPLSHGYIQYSIKPANSFIQNTVIENLADIYFDFNTPVRTNTVQSTADNSLGMKTVTGETGFEVFPNPIAFDNWQLRVSDTYIGQAYIVYDITGKLLFTAPANNNTTVIETQKLSTGVYFLHFNGYVKRLIKL